VQVENKKAKKKQKGVVSDSEVSASVLESSRDFL
jgi:hypothetical protein